MSNVRHFGAVGDGSTDDTEAIRHAVAEGDGVLHFPVGRYRLTETVVLPLGAHGPMAVHGDGGASTVIMEGEGPAFRLLGTGDPGTLSDQVRDQERFPGFRQLVIEGAHPEADGVESIGAMQLTMEGMLIRKVRHGILLRKRNRNVLISQCHIYHNTGVSLYLDGVNLHQINVIGNHLSYNRLGGIRIERSEIRNLQITGNDIEYNNSKSHPGTEDLPTAEIHVDTTAEGASVNEVTIASNTIQATGTAGGANIRIMEQAGTGRPPGLWAISGNVIGSQEVNVHLKGCYGVVLSGNTIYSCLKHNLLVEDSSQINITGNHFRRHTPQYGTGVRVERSQDCVLSSCQFLDESETGQKSGKSLLELESSSGLTVSACQFIDGVPYGVDAHACRDVCFHACLLVERREPKRSRGVLRFTGKGERNAVEGCSVLGPSTIEAESGVVVRGNLES